MTAAALKRHKKESKDATVTSTGMPVKDDKAEIFLVAAKQTTPVGVQITLAQVHSNNVQIETK